MTSSPQQVILGASAAAKNVACEQDSSSARSAGGAAEWSEYLSDRCVRNVFLRCRGHQFAETVYLSKLVEFSEL